MRFIYAFYITRSVSVSSIRLTYLNDIMFSTYRAFYVTNEEHLAAKGLVEACPIPKGGWYLAMLLYPAVL